MRDLDEMGLKEKATILVVDDERANRKLLAELVRLDGHYAFVAAGGAEALEMLQSQTFDIVLLDLMMPEVSGLDVLDELARLGRTPMLPVVVVTAMTERAVCVDALQRGASDFLSKPIDRNELRARVTNLVALKRARDLLVRRGLDLEHIVERKTAEASQLDQRLHLVADLLPMTLFEVDFEDPEPRAEWVVGNPQDLLGLHEKHREKWFALVHPDDQQRIQRVWRDLRDGSRREWNLRYRSRGTEPDEYSWIAMVGKMLPNSHRALGAMFDISESKALEEALFQSQKMEAVGDLASGVAHDFNNLLTAIVSFAEFVHMDLEEGDPRRADIEEVLSASSRASDLTRQLLAFSRRGGSARSVFNLNEHLKGAGALLRRTAGPLVEVTVSTSALPAVVEMDPVHLDQILVNLAASARDAMRNGGNLHFTVERSTQSSFARLEMTDHPTGVEVATNWAVAPSFVPVGSGKGTGVGLAICRSIVEDNGGEFAVQRDARGARRIQLDLPLTDQPAEEETPSEEDLSADGELVLVAENEPALRAVVKRTLEAAGYQVLLARDGIEAIRLLRERRDEIEIVFTDIIMPGRSGHDVVEAAKRYSRSASIVVTSGYVDEASRLGRTLIDDRPLLWKPYTPTMLLQAMRRARQALGAPNPARESLSPESILDPPDMQFATGLGSDSTSAEAVPTGALVLVTRPEGAAETLAALREAGLPSVQAPSLPSLYDAVQEEDFALLVVDADTLPCAVEDLFRNVRSVRPNLPILVVARAPSSELVRAVARYGSVGYLARPFAADEANEAIEETLRAGRVATLQSKLIAARAGADTFLTNLDATEKAFDEALRTLRMAYQPIVRSRDHTVFGYEALMRSDVPAFPNPMVLLAAAEVLGRVIELGRVVRSRVRDDIQGLAEGVPVFVNLHPMELREKYLGAEDEPLRGCARRVVLEVTERASLSAGPRLNDEVRALRRHGYRIAVDDLGEGYAGLASLTQLTPDIVKIDRSLVQRIEASPLKEDIIASIVLMSRKAGITTVAEGVETAEERDVVTMLGCDLLQGYYFARPGPPFPGLINT